MDVLEMYGKKDIVVNLTGMSGKNPVIDGELCTVWSDGDDAVILYINPEIPVLREMELNGYYHYRYIWKLEYHNHGEKVLEKNIGMNFIKGRIYVHLTDLREFLDQCRSAKDVMDKFSTHRPLEACK